MMYKWTGSDGQEREKSPFQSTRERERFAAEWDEARARVLRGMKKIPKAVASVASVVSGRRFYG